MTIELVFILALATYRLTILINEEKGALDIAERFRTWAGIYRDEKGNRRAKNGFAEAVLCPYCLSVWLGLLITGAALAEFLLTGRIVIIAWLLLPFALSGVAFILKRVGG